MKKIVISTIISIALTSSLANANSCKEEKDVLETIKLQKVAIDSEITQAKAGLVGTSLTTLPALVWYTAVLQQYRQNFTIGTHILGASYFALAGTNIILKKSDINYYKSMSMTLDKLIQEREISIQNDNCLSDRAEKSDNENIKELYQALKKINQQLRNDVYKLSAEIGNSTNNASNLVSVSGSVLLGGSFLLSKISGVSQNVYMHTFSSGLFLNIASQMTMLPSTLMARSEAVKLLNVIKEEQKKLLAQEQLLEELL